MINHQKSTNIINNTKTLFNEIFTDPAAIKMVGLRVSGNKIFGSRKQDRRILAWKNNGKGRNT